MTRELLQQAQAVINRLINSTSIRDPQPWRDARADASDFMKKAEAALAQPVQPATSLNKVGINQSVNIAACGIDRDHTKCWRHQCEVEGKCVAPIAQSPTTREAFEAWVSTAPRYSPPLTFSIDSQGLREMAMHVARETWQAATAHEREACAKECESVDFDTAECPEMAKLCAYAIRARSNE